MAVGRRRRGEGRGARALWILILGARALWILIPLSLAGLFATPSSATVRSGPSYVPPRCQPHTYRSAPNLKAQRVCMNLGVSTHGTTPRTFLFLTPGGIDKTGAGIFRDNGQLVWWHPAHGASVFNLTVVRYRGHRYLALWSGHGVDHDQYYAGTITLYNQRYQKVGRITTGGAFPPAQIDPHEFHITPDGDALIGFDDPVTRKIRGHRTTVLQYVVQKLALVGDQRAIHTGRVLFQWKSLSHVPVSRSYFPDPGRGGIWDYFHGNSIAQDSDGNLIVSARNTWGIYKINVKTGRMMWQLGGKGEPGLHNRWCYQHDVTPLGHNRYSVYDDGGSYFGCYPVKAGHAARGIVISVHPRGGHVSLRLVRAYSHDPRIDSVCCGSIQLLGAGHALLDWGQVPLLTEYASPGRTDMELSMSGWSYRAYRFPWVGRPETRPAVAGQRGQSGTQVWVSWNGATNVAAWQILAGTSATHLSAVGQPVSKTGFETRISLAASYQYVAARALDSGHDVLSTSRPVATKGQPAAARPARDGGSASTGKPARGEAMTVVGRAALHVIPFPGTPDASPQSQIIFSSLGRSDLRRVIVVASSSGLHQGRLRALPHRAGTAFVPAHGFTPGETVTVQASLTSRRAGTASGDPGAMTLRFSFTVATPPHAASPSARGAQAQAPAPPHRVFRSAPGLHPPPVHVSRGPAPGSRDIFLSPRSPGSHPGSTTQGMMILNPRGQLIWFRAANAPFNLEVQQYQGHPVLTWFQLGRHGGEDVILNGSYRSVAVLHAGWGYHSDVHEFQLTPQGTALIDAYVPVRADLSSVGGPADGTMLDCVIQELDVRTGTVLWEWHALGHVPLTASYLKPGSGAYEPYHLNSIQQLPGHRLLVSMHNTWAVYEIDELTGRVIWTLGGRRSDFKMGAGTTFAWQHDAHLQDHGLMTLFDDASAAFGDAQEQQSSAEELKVNFRARTVSLVHRYRHSPPLLSGTQGSAQLLYDHDLFVGWGSEPDFSEYTTAGRQIFSASFPLGLQSYRAYRFPWTGHPLTRPALALSRRGHGTVWLYASWNGATRVASWRVLGGRSPHSLKALRVKRWTGFETATALPHPESYVAVQALGPHGSVLGRSRILATRSA